MLGFDDLLPILSRNRNSLSKRRRDFELRLRFHLAVRGAEQVAVACTDATDEHARGTCGHAEALGDGSVSLAGFAGKEGFEGVE